MADPLPTKLHLTIVTRERKIVETDVDEVELPATDGEIGILPGHTPLLAMLKIGQMKYRTGSQVMRLVLTWGFAEVLPESVIVMAEAGPPSASATKRSARWPTCRRTIRSSRWSKRAWRRAWR